jgi:hypothetical protein
MTLTIDISPEIEAALQEHIARTVRPANVDGQAVLVPLFPSIEAFFESVLQQVFESLLRQYPPAVVAQKLEQIRGLEDQVRTASRAMVRRVTSPRPETADGG